MPSKNTICLWYDRDALEAAQFYARTFPDSAVSKVLRAPGDYPSGKQGDVLTVADVAAVMAAKRTPDLIPMCHSLALTGVDVDFSEILEPDAEGCVGIKVTTTARCVGQTGVEMEALTAASAALLTIYDMCKAIDRGMRIEAIQLEEKRGGKSGVWRRERTSEAGK